MERIKRQSGSFITLKRVSGSRSRAVGGWPLARRSFFFCLPVRIGTMRLSRKDCDIARFASRLKRLAVFGESGVGMDGAFASNPRIALSRTQF